MNKPFSIVLKIISNIVNNNQRTFDFPVSRKFGVIKRDQFGLGIILKKFFFDYMSQNDALKCGPQWIPPRQTKEYKASNF